MRHRLISAWTPIVLLSALACEPGVSRPGAWLSGEESSAPVTDWTFTNAFQNCYLEAGTWYGVPHSVTIWCAAHDGGIYVGSYSDSGDFAGDRAWEKHVARNGEGAIRVDGKIYRGTWGRVEDPALTKAIRQSYATKYGHTDTWKRREEDPPAWRFYRLDQRG